jgi:putative Ca2+/H+ antiporter (TMEM165/GDT1 family)
VNLIAALTAFALIFPIELPDKTFIATIVLATRLPARMVWLGVSAAFGVQCVVAVVAGKLITYLPKTLVLSVTGLAFLIGGLILLRGAKSEAKEEELEEAEFESRVKEEAKGPLTGYRAALVSFGIIFAAEWGDLSQILSAGLVAQGKDPIGVFVGSWAALVAVSGLGVIVGKRLTAYISVTVVRQIGGGLCLLLSLLTALKIFGVF